MSSTSEIKSTECLVAPHGIGETTNSIASLKVLTSSMPPVVNAVVKNKRLTKAGSKRGRKKKKLPLKVSQPTILPKVFAIQIAPQANIVAPVTSVVNQSILQNTANKSLGPIAYHPQVTNVAQAPYVQSKGQKVNINKTTEEQKEKLKTRQESIKIAGTFQYATNNSEPAQFGSEDLDIGSRGFQKINQKRLVHNASEKRRKEKINGWIAKIATALFKHCPEKQHKIYILEKAYNFIVERTRSQQTIAGKQDAFTQAGEPQDPVQNETFADLVKKVIELENILASLLKVIRKHKIPAPPSLFKSRYVNTLAASQLDGSDIISKARILATDIQSPVIPNGSSRLASTPNQVDGNHCLDAESSKSNIESASQAQSQASETNASRQSINTLNPSVNFIPTTQLNPISPTVEADLNVARGSASAGRPILQVSSISSHASNSWTTPTDAQNSVGVSGLNVQAVSSYLQPSGLTKQSNSLENQNISNNIVSTEAKIVNSVPQTIVSRTISSLQNDATNPARQMVACCSNATPNTSSMRQSDANKEIPVKAPSMESQMFVMKNLVHSRNKINIYNYNPIANVQTSSSGSSVQPTKDAFSKGGTAEGCRISGQNAAVEIAQGSKANVMLVDTRVLRPDNGVGSSSTEASFVRIESQLSAASQPMQETSVNNVLLSTLSPQIPVTSTVSVATKKRPQKPSTLLLNTGIQSNVSTDPSLQQLRTISTHPVPVGMQTCHSVTSLLSNMTTSPTENSALSIDRILANRPGYRQEMCPTTINKQTLQPFASSLSDQRSSKSDVVPRKRPSSSRAPKKQNNSQTSNSLQISCNQNTASSKPSPKRAKKNPPPQYSPDSVNMQTRRSVSQFTPATAASNTLTMNSKGKKEDRSKHKRQNTVRSSTALNIPQGGAMSLPKPHSFVSLARKDQRKKSNALGQFSTESLLRNVNGPNTQAFVGDSEQDMSLPTILNIFAPASIGSMVNQMPMSSNLPNAQNINNSSTFPTIQSTFSNFSAETLIGGQMESQPSVNAVINAAPSANDNPLVQSEQQTLFTDFSTDALLAGTESSLSYGIDNIMSRNDVVASNSCVSPNWLQTGSFIDNSPIRGSFNQGLNIFDTPNNMQGYLNSVQNTIFSTPIKWRQDGGRSDEQNANLTPSSSATPIGLWGQGFPTSAQKTSRNGQNKDTPKSKGTRGQPSSKRGPSFGDFLLVDSVS